MKNTQRFIITAIPFTWLIALFLIPFFIILKISLSDIAIAIPPYTPVLDEAFNWQNLKNFFAQLDFESYLYLTTDDLYWIAYLTSIKIAAISTALCLLVAFPIAYGIARAPQRWRATLVMLVILPFWTSFLIRVYAWVGILSNEGIINNTLQWLGIINEPIQMLNTNFSVYIGIVYTYLPFLVLPIYANLDKMDPALLEAAQDLGCSRIGAFWLVTFPLARPGIVAGCMLVFIPAIGEFVIPSLLGGSSTVMIGKVLWDEFFSNRDWPIASAVAIVLLLLLLIPIVYFQKTQQKIQDKP